MSQPASLAALKRFAAIRDRVAASCQGGPNAILEMMESGMAEAAKLSESDPEVFWLLHEWVDDMHRYLNGEFDPPE